MSSCFKCGMPEHLHGPKPDPSVDDGFGGETWYHWHPFESLESATRQGNESENCKWQPIETAPDATEILLWWTPVDGNKHAECAVIGSISIHEDGKWWNGQKGHYEDLARITHWMPLPEPPQPSQREGK